MFSTFTAVVFLTALAMQRGLIAPLKLFELRRNKHKGFNRASYEKKTSPGAQLTVNKTAILRVNLE